MTKNDLKCYAREKEYSVLNKEKKREIYQYFIKNIDHFLTSSQYSKTKTAHIVKFDKIENVNEEKLKIITYEVIYKISIIDKIYDFVKNNILKKSKRKFRSFVQKRRINKLKPREMVIDEIRCQEEFRAITEALDVHSTMPVFHSYDLSAAIQGLRTMPMWKIGDKSIEKFFKSKKNIEIFEVCYTEINFITYQVNKYSGNSNLIKNIDSIDNINNAQMFLNCFTEEDIKKLEKCHLGYKKTGLKEYIEFRDFKIGVDSIISYILSHKKTRAIELLLKANMPNIAAILLKQILLKSGRIKYNEKATKVYEVFEIPKNLLRQLEIDSKENSNLEYTLLAWNDIGKDLSLSDSLLENIAKDNGSFGIEFRSRIYQISDCFSRYNYNINQVYLYLKRIADSDDCVTVHPYLHERSIVGYFGDYVRMGEEMNVRYKKFPKSLSVEHDKVSAIYKIKQDEALQDNFNDVVNEYRYLEFKNNEFTIMLPKTINDLAREGSELKHCVASYAKRMANEESVILFLRKNENIDKPYYTIELRDNRITQIRGFNNEDLEDKDALKFTDYWKGKYNIS